MTRYIRRLLLPWLAVTMVACGPRAVEHVDPETGLSSWKAEHRGLSIELVQVLPDYVRAVYASKRLPREVVEKVASQCVFGTILRNLSQEPLTYDVGRWRYITPDGREHRIRTKSEWVREWQDMGIAFRWSLLPEKVTFGVGDWDQGFMTLALPPGAEFDLEYSWTVGGATHRARLEGLRCAPAAPPVKPEE